jgi:hypothetical protein
VVELCNVLVLVLIGAVLPEPASPLHHFSQSLVRELVILLLFMSDEHPLPVFFFFSIFFFFFLSEQKNLLLRRQCKK